MVKKSTGINLYLPRQNLYLAMQKFIGMVKKLNRNESVFTKVEIYLYVKKKTGMNRYLPRQNFYLPRQKFIGMVKKKQRE